MSEGSTRDSQTDPNSDMPDFAAFSPTLKKYQQTRDLYHGRLQGRLTSGGPGCLMAILCPLSADQLTAAGPPIWSMLAVWLRARLAIDFGSTAGRAPLIVCLSEGWAKPLSIVPF
jgi:hypothetical protein